MIRMYCYANYKFSPVGFAIGSVSLPINSTAAYTELENHKDDFIKKCFETGFITSVYGKNPKNKHFYFMVKGLRSEFINEDNMPSHKKGNFIFEFDNVDEYKRFFRNFDETKLAAAMNEFIVPDSFAETYALKLDTNKLNEYIASVLSAETDTGIKVECNDLYFDTTSSEPNVSKELTQMLGYPVFKTGNDRFATRVNFQKPTLRKVLRVIAVIVAILGGIALIAGLVMWIFSLIRP